MIQTFEGPLPDTTLTVTGGWLPSSTIGDQTWYPNGYPWDGSTYVYQWPTTPTYCAGNVHVFGCDHAEKCKCGKSKRKVEPPTCAHCGKAHG